MCAKKRRGYSKVHSSFPANLRLLCSYKASIAEVCRTLGINRSQFNRYLSGSTLPRAGLMRTICDFFGVELHEMLLPADDFDRLIRVRGVPERSPGRMFEKHFERILQMSEARVLRLSGMFFEYYHSMSSPGSILRSLVVFEERDGSMVYRRLERIGPTDRVCGRHYRYQGIAVMLGDRIFLTDYEYGLNVELTQTVLYPDYSNRVNRLVGVKVGVAAHQQRTPCCTRVYLERVGAGSSWFGNLRRCGIFREESPDVPAEIKAVIDNHASGPHHFMARLTS